MAEADDTVRTQRVRSRDDYVRNGVDRQPPVVTASGRVRSPELTGSGEEHLEGASQATSPCGQRPMRLLTAWRNFVVALKAAMIARSPAESAAGSIPIWRANARPS
jgi:hypothetical protein